MGGFEDVEDALRERDNREACLFMKELVGLCCGTVVYKRNSLLFFCLAAVDLLCS